MPVWNIEAFTLLDGRLVLLGGEEEVREGLWVRGREEGKGMGPWKVSASPSTRLPSLSDYSLLRRSRGLASPGWGAPALRAASRWPWGTSGMQVRKCER